ncbi:MAG: OmpA family protein [Mariprofundus sp.]|nr:OmpA family protein [Mariprofundus sp.]
MNRFTTFCCLILLGMLPACASIDAFLFDANPDGTPLTTKSQPAATLDEEPSSPLGQQNSTLRSENDVLKEQLRAAEDELAALQKAALVVKPTDQLWARITFKSGMLHVAPQTRKALTDIAGKFLATTRDMHLEIKGYSDDEPVGGYHHSHKPRHAHKTVLALTQARADAVAAVMIAAGISEDLIKSTGYGATGFVSDNSSAAGRQKNRRVDIHLVSGKLAK